MEFYDTDHEYHIDIGLGDCAQRSTTINHCWTDYLGDIHLDISIKLMDTKGEGKGITIPNMILPMNGIISIDKSCTANNGVVHAQYNPLTNCPMLPDMCSVTNPATGEKEIVDSPCYLAVAELEPRRRPMTLEQIESALGYKIEFLRR